jgi:hypothetical protein
MSFLRQLLQSQVNVTKAVVRKSILMQTARVRAVLKPGGQA